eukprot:sb/3477887/
MTGLHSIDHNSSKNRCCRELSGEHFGCKIDIPSLTNRQINRLKCMHPWRHSHIVRSHQVSMSPNCIPCRKLSSGHYGTRVFVLARCLRCLMTDTQVVYLNPIMY